MSNLIAVAYEDVGTARSVLGELGELSAEHAITLDDAVILERRPDGKVKLHQTTKPGAAGAAGGALWGGLIGLLFLAPLFGMAIGAASGAIAGKFTDVGVNDDFLKQLGAKIPEGGAALIALGKSDAPDKVLERLGHHGGEVIQTSLSEDDEERVRAALGESTATA